MLAKQLVLIALGGALGAVLRFGMSSAMAGLFGRAFPYGTLTVNVVGSFAIGTLYVLLVERYAEAAEWRAFALVGLLGALTTFSTFSLDTLQLLENGAPLRAGANVLANVLLCLIACWAGLVLVRQL